MTQLRAAALLTRLRLFLQQPTQSHCSPGSTPRHPSNLRIARVCDGGRLDELWHKVGIYTGRILKGDKPADLPVMQSIKFELVIN